MSGSKQISPTGNTVGSPLRTLFGKMFGFMDFKSSVCQPRRKGHFCESWQCPALNLWPKVEPLRMFHILSKVNSGFSGLFVSVFNSISDS